MRFSISTALLAHLLVGQSLAARVIVNDLNQLQTIEQGTPTLNTSLKARQVPINGNETPRDGAIGGAPAPKDMQPKPNEVLPPAQPPPVLPGTLPKPPVPVSSAPPAKPPMARRVRRGTPVMQRRSAPPPSSSPPPPIVPPKNGPDGDTTLPNIVPQPKVPGVPIQPKVPVPVETDKPVPMTFAR